VASRRGVVRATLSATAVALLAGCASRGMATGSESTAAKDVELLNTALRLEWEAIAAYQVGAESRLLEPGVLAVAVAFQNDHKAHADLLTRTIRQLGGKAAEAEPVAAYGFRTERLTNQAAVLGFAAELEKQAASSYLATVPLFTNRDLAKAAASIMGAEAQHWAVLRSALGQPPVAASFIA
jgi:rubrerythrin